VISGNVVAGYFRDNAGNTLPIEYDGVKRDQLTYYHVELPRHAVILAEEFTVESYLDLGDRANFNQDDDVIRLIPDFTSRLAGDAAKAWETLGAAPLVMAGALLAQARNLVALPVSRQACQSRARIAQGVCPVAALDDEGPLRVDRCAVG
jgi:hypothetical protein